MNSRKEMGFSRRLARLPKKCRSKRRLRVVVKVEGDCCSNDEMDMATNQVSEFIQHLRRTMLLRDGAALSDKQLLEDFLNSRDEAAIDVLVRRHGPMVWGVCRRLLNHHDAEDAFQATFLVLVHKAASIASRDLLANWLYGVAHQTALKARATVAKRKGRERQMMEMPEPAATEQDLWRDLEPLLDQELSRLPDKYRAVIVLCELEGKTRKEAAQQLGVPEGTVSSRMATARAMLAKRMARHGLSVSGGTLATVLTEKVASAGVPPSVLSSTIKAVSVFAAGQAATTGVIPFKVAALTEGVVKAMLLTKLKAALAVVLLLGFLATGVTVLNCRTAAGQDDKKPAAEKPIKPTAKQEKQKDKETFTAWGKEVGGLQAGLVFRPGEHRAYHHGETVTLVVRVRNVGRETVKFSYLQPFFEHPLTVANSDCKPVPQPDLSHEWAKARHPKEVTLPPGKEISLHELKRHLRPESESGSNKSMQPYALYGTGKISLWYEQVFGVTDMVYRGGQRDPALSKLATGKLELEVKDAELPRRIEKK